MGFAGAAGTAGSEQAGARGGPSASATASSGSSEGCVRVNGVLFRALFTNTAGCRRMGGCAEHPRARGAGRAADVMLRAAGGAHVFAATAPRSALPVPLAPGSAQPRTGARTRGPPSPCRRSSRARQPRGRSGTAAGGRRSRPSAAAPPPRPGPGPSPLPAGRPARSGSAEPAHWAPGRARRPRGEERRRRRWRGAGRARPGAAKRGGGGATLRGGGGGRPGRHAPCRGPGSPSCGVAAGRGAAPRP